MRRFPHFLLVALRQVPALGILVLGLTPAILMLACSNAEPAAPTLTPTPSLQPMPPQSPAVAPGPTTAPQSEEPLELVGSRAPDFAFTLFQGDDVLGGRSLRLAQIKGKPIVLNFWARYCGPCWTEMPELQDFYEVHKGRLQLLGIDLGQFTGLGSPKDAGKLLDSLGITYPAGFTDDAHVVRSYQVAAMPTTVFIDSEGVVFRTWSGSITRQQLEAIVVEMLATNSQ